MAIATKGNEAAGSKSAEWSPLLSPRKECLEEEYRSWLEEAARRVVRSMGLPQPLAVTRPKKKLRSCWLQPRKWHPLSKEPVESHRVADEVAAAPTGKMFATSR